MKWVLILIYAYSIAVLPGTYTDKKSCEDRGAGIVNEWNLSENAKNKYSIEMRYLNYLCVSLNDDSLHNISKYPAYDGTLHESIPYVVTPVMPSVSEFKKFKEDTDMYITEIHDRLNKLEQHNIYGGVECKNGVCGYKSYYRADTE